MRADGDLGVQRGLVIPADELVMSASRASGPGGQNVNKLSTRVTLRWSVTGSRVLSEGRRARLLQKLSSRLTKDGDLLVSADAARSQSGNRRLARERLAEMVCEALRVPKARRKTRPTRASKQRRLESKSQRSDVKQQRRRPTSED